MFLLYVHANAVNNNKGNNNNSDPDNAVSMDFTLKVMWIDNVTMVMINYQNDGNEI